MDAKTTELISPRSTMVPKFFYYWRNYTDLLHRANLLTGEQSCHQILGYQLKFGCCWSELPGGGLLFTGGSEEYQSVCEVVKIDTLREWAVSYQPPMLTPRQNHAAVYHSQYLYVLAGRDYRGLRECERYSVVESRWEVLPYLPVAGYGMSAVEVESSVYALGGYDSNSQDTVQKLSLDSLTWELMQLKLPQAATSFPCFKTDTQVYLVLEKTLYSFTPLQVKAVKTVPVSVFCSSSYYSRGTLYYSCLQGLKSLAEEELA
jgi:hypothetical protein